jgi:hypothetical protein
VRHAVDVVPDGSMTVSPCTWALTSLVLRLATGRDELELLGPHRSMRSKDIFESAEALGRRGRRGGLFLALKNGTVGLQSGLAAWLMEQIGKRRQGQEMSSKPLVASPPGL